ncbi:hypothetical protein [Candidatus Poriferisodalis sp.]|uniref:hypothetical protein n=1 Tax=Candidatus Poriferisodalis sp. TaxID=3101277 RepID=UPI003D0F07EC
MTNGASTSDAAPQDPHLGEITDFLGLRPTEDELRWLMPVTFDVAGATGTLHGGCGLAAAVAALETVTGRPMAARLLNIWLACPREVARRSLWTSGQAATA